MYGVSFLEYFYSLARNLNEILDVIFKQIFVIDGSGIIFKQLLVIDGWGISCEIALIWMSLDFAGDQSTLVQVMAWCRLATSHYPSQCWPRSLLPYWVTRPQWVTEKKQICYRDSTLTIFSLQSLADQVAHHLASHNACSKQLLLRCPLCVNPTCAKTKQFFARSQSVLDAWRESEQLLQAKQ